MSTNPPPPPNEPSTVISGVIVKGHGVASGTGTDRRYPAGTVSMQRSFFASRGLDLSGCFAGTLNVNISPAAFALLKPAHTFQQVEWTHLHPPEDFSFCHCRVVHRGREHEGWVYTPHPQTKAAHFHSPSILEILAPFIPGLACGDSVELILDPSEIAIRY